VNTLDKSVKERISDILMLPAVGMRPRSVLAQVVIESSVLMLIGVAVGIALGLAGIFAMGDGLDLSLWSEGVESFGMRTLLRPVPLFDDVLLIALLSLGLGVVASLYPAWRAIKIKPLEALRR
ncbi:MAG: FtsX-like permease family protein, partial [Gammaproteobacteria bacterium]|nr:FtsX-like permease family protein [Gammaproteobacteria bacterium]